jgi:hypothetical protein
LGSKPEIATGPTMWLEKSEPTGWAGVEWS